MTSSIRLQVFLCALLAWSGVTGPAFAATFVVNAGAPAGGDGSIERPLRSLRAAEEASGPGDTVVIVRGTGPYDEGISLERGQTLTASAEPAAEAAPLIRVKENAAIVARNAAELTIRDIAIELSGTAHGIVLHGVTGTVSIEGGGVTGNTTGTAFDVDGGDAAITVRAFPVSLKSGTAVAIRNRTGGAAIFEKGSVLTIFAGAQPAVVLADNQGRYAFGDALRVTTKGATALTIRKSGSVSIAGPESQIVTAGAAAVELSDVAAEIALGSVSVDGARSTDHGVRVERLTGTLLVAGGTIRDVRKRGISIVKSAGIVLRDMKVINAPAANAATAQVCGNPVASGEHLACGAAIHLHEVDGMTLERVTIEGGAQLAVNGDTLKDLTMTAVQVRGAGDENNEHGVQLRNLAGKVRLSDVRIEGNESRQLHVVQDTGEVDIDIRGSTFRGTAPPNGQQAILLHASGPARVGLVIDGSTFTDNFGNAVQLLAEGSSSITTAITGNTFRKNAAAVIAAAGNGAKLQYRIAKNTIEQSTSTALNIHATTTETVSGEIAANSVDGVLCGGGCSGISVTAIGRGTSSSTISGNKIQRTDANGILVRAGGDAVLRARINGNSVREPAGTDTMHAIAVTAGMRKTDRAAVCVEIGGAGDLVNTISGAWNVAGGGSGIGLTRRGDGGSLSIARYAGDRTNVAGLSKFVAGYNRGASVEASIGGGVTLSDGCSTP